MKHFLSLGRQGVRFGRDDIRGRDTSEYSFGELEQVLKPEAGPLHIPSETLLIDSAHISRMRAILLKDGERQMRLIQQRAAGIISLPIAMGCACGAALAAGILAFC